MKWFLVLVALAAAPAMAGAQDFLGKWKVARIFTTQNFQKDTDNRMLLLMSQAQHLESRVDGVLLPKDMIIEFSIDPKYRAQHVTLSNQGQLLMSLNWKVRDTPAPPLEPGDPSLKVWSGDEDDYDIYALLFNDPHTLVFSDKSKAGNRFLDIYYLERD